jgi:signal transduction histidine kinase
MTLPVRRILIVDDSPEDRELYRRFFLVDTTHRYLFLEADSGADGLELCVSEHPDCLLLDYRMPDLDGLSFLQALPRDEDGINVPVIVLTGQGSEAVAVEAMKNGAQDYLLKSTIDSPSLLRAVENAIDKVQLRRSIRTRTRELSDTNAELQREVGQRKRAEEALQRTYDDLERLIAARTEELQKANRELSIEVAERRRIEEERAQLLVREQQANRLKDEFLATVSHELRTPLNAVLGWTRVLRSGQMSAALQERALESIERNAMAQARLIEDILEVSRIVTGKLRLRVRPLDLVHVIDAALDVVRPAAEAKSIRLERHIDPGQWPGVGDPDRLQQVVWNLLSNAVKFTPRGGTVRVSLDRDDAVDQIVVADSGRGIDPGFLPHVFAPFRQADASTTREQGGLGLGLAIARQLVEMHGGTVRAESEGLGLGARFTVSLPAQAGRRGDRERARARAARPDASTRVGHTAGPHRHSRADGRRRPRRTRAGHDDAALLRSRGDGRRVVGPGARPLLGSQAGRAAERHRHDRRGRIQLPSTRARAPDRAGRSRPGRRRDGIRSGRGSGALARGGVPAAHLEALRPPGTRPHRAAARGRARRRTRAELTIVTQVSECVKRPAVPGLVDGSLLGPTGCRSGQARAHDNGVRSLPGTAASAPNSSVSPQVQS